MLQGAIAGFLSGFPMFILFTIADIAFFRRFGQFKAARHYDREARRLIVLLLIALFHASIVGLFFGLFHDGIPGATSVARGLLFGLAAGLILSRQSIEAVLFFDEEYIPRRYGYYWLLEYAIGYTLVGGLMGVIFDAL